MMNLSLWQRSIRNAALENGQGSFEGVFKRIPNQGIRRSSAHPDGYRYESTGEDLVERIKRQHNKAKWTSFYGDLES